MDFLEGQALIARFDELLGVEVRANWIGGKFQR
jgi:hypothetical protein